MIWVELMIEEWYKIYVDRLKGGASCEFSGEVDSDFLAVEDLELSFKGPVDLTFEAYLVENRVIIHWDASVDCILPCVVCNQKFSLPIVIERENTVLDLTETREIIHDIRPLLREAILLEVPAFAECHDGQCPERKHLEPFLRSAEKEDEDTHQQFPFTGL